MNNGEDLKKIAEKVIVDGNLYLQDYGNPLMIIMIIGIILNCIRVIQECNNNRIKNLSKEKKKELFHRNIKRICGQRGWYAKMRIRKFIRQELKPEEYKNYHKQMTDSIFNLGENITEEEMTTILEALNV